MKIWTLIENTACCEELTAEHGLSLYIEAGSRKLLFDTGRSGVFAENAGKMGVDLAAVDTAVLSHGHDDHGGGLDTFLKLNGSAPVYVSSYAFEPHYNAAGRYGGLNPSLMECDRLRFVDGEQKIGDAMTLFSCNDRQRRYPSDPAGLFVQRNGVLQPDDFLHEQYLLAEEEGKRILISGCSHKGILNIMEWFRPDVLVGGFHFMKLDPQSPALAEAGRRLAEFDCQYYTGHCTGAEQQRVLKEILGDRLQPISTGSMIEL